MRNEGGKAVHHGMSGFAYGDNYDAGNTGQVNAGAWKNEARVVQLKLALHYRRNIDGGENLVEYFASDLFCGWHVSTVVNSGLLENLWIQHIGRALPFKDRNDIVGGNDGHLGTCFQRSGSEMRRQDYVGAFEAGVNERLIFKDVESSAGDFTVFKRRNESGFIHDGTTGCVDEKGGRLHPVKLGSVKEGARLWKERHVQADEIGFREERVHVAEFRVDRIFNFLRSANRIRIDHLHLETGAAAGNGMANAAETDNTESLAPNIGAAELIEIPALPISGTSEKFTFAEAASDGHEQSPGKIGGGFIKNARSVGGDDASFGASVNIDVVEADGGIGNDAEFGGGAEEFFIDFFGEEADQPLSVSHPAQNFFT